MNCAMSEPAPAPPADGLTEDAWRGGRLTLLQPHRGHRVGSDAALLAAATAPVPNAGPLLGGGVVPFKVRGDASAAPAAAVRAEGL
jgi:tRNA1(Val) A37 N6-methylase TrmN6